MDTRHCSLCNVDKFSSEFNKSKNPPYYQGYCRDCSKAKHKKWYEKNREREAARRRIRTETKGRQEFLRLRYNLTEEEYYQMKKDQNNECKICKINFDTKGIRACVDHCHDSLVVRGLLCSQCNSMLGMAKDNPQTLQAGIDYLASYSRSDIVYPSSTHLSDTLPD